MTRDEFLARRRAAAEQQDEETTAQRPAVSSAASTGMTREEFLERRRAGMEAAEQQPSPSVSRPTSVSPDTDSTLRRLAAAKEQNRKTTRAGLEETRTGSGRQLPGASGKLGDMLLDATRYQQAHKTGPSGEDALAYGVMSGTGAASLAALAGRALTGERADWYNDYQREAAEAAQAHPAAYGIGNVGGSLGIAYATGGLAGAATGALLTGEGAATAAGTVIKGLARNAMTFAMTDAIHNAGAFAADSMSDRDFINSMGVGMAQGAAGGLAAGLVSSGMANVLRKHNLMTPFMEFVRQTAAGTASAGANIATSYALRENKPTKEQMAQQFATAFLLSALQGAISTYETVQANKDQLEQYTAQMVKTWQQMAAQGQAAGMDRTQAGQQAFADQIRDLSTQIRFTLGRTYMAGQQQYVNNLYSLLDTLDDMIDTSMAQNAEWVYDTPVSPYNDAMLGSGEDIVPQLTEAITTGMTEGANQPPTPPVTPEAPVDTTIAAAGAQTPAPPEVSPETEEALRALTEQPDVPAAPETPQEPEIETPEEVIPPEPETPAAPEPEPEPEPAAEPETVSPAETLRQNAEAGGLGKKGQQAIGDFYSGGMDPEQLTQYYAGFSAYYKAGGDGVPAERVRTPFADVLSEQAKIGAWSSGRADALAEGRTIPEPEPMPAAPETAVAQTEPSGYNEITEQPKPETVQPEPMTTAETAKPTVEQAKADLKRAIQVPVQTGNLEALREAIKSGDLSPDVVTMGSKVPGFTREQQESLARQIIEGQQDGKEVIHADVPGDGRFDINTSDQDAVPNVLNALHVKVNQEAVITKDIDSWLKRSGKSGRSYVGRADDQYFLSDGYAAVRVPKAAADYALKEPAYKAQPEDFRAQLNAAKVASGTLEEPRRGKMTVRGQATQVYAFRTADGVLAFPKDAFSKIDGGTLSYGPMGRGFIAVSRGEDGEVRAFALALDPKTFRQEDYNGFAPVKIKATLAAADTSTDNGLPAAGAQGAAEPAETMEQAPEEKPEKEESRAAEPETTPKQPHELLADEVEKALQSGKTLTGRDLTAMADKAFGGTRGENAYDIKTAYDAMELGVNRYLMKADFVREGNGDAASAVKTEQRLQALMAQLPTQSVRTEEQQQYQQFSTPPNIAYLAAWAANINDKDVVLEPSAGIGGLALWGKAWGATVYGNELSERRANILRSLGLDEVFTENAEQINNVLPDRVQPTVVVMNPPFSATAGRLSANNTANAKRHIEQALDRLNDGGRLVAILGNGMADDSRAFKTWWNDLRKEYDIRANLSINGENYRKYGTTFDVQMVVIDKTGPQQGETLRGEVKDLTKVPEMLEGIRDDRTRVEGRAAESERSGTERVSEPQPAGRERGGAAGRTGRSTGGRSRAGAVAAVADDEIRGRSEPERADEAVREADDGAGREELGESGGETAAADAGESADERIAEPEPERTLPKLKKKQKEPEPSGDESVYAEYVPPPTKIKGAKKHPAKLVESAAMSAVSIPPADYVPNLPKELITSGALSDAQLSNIVYAGQAHSQMIPQQGKRKGYFIGDGTGVGKGRQISGIILDNFRQGRTKALWISKGQNLFGDAQRDWADIGGKKEDVFSLSKTKADEKVKAPKGIMFTTYDTLANKSKTTKKTRLDQIVEWLGPDFDGVIAFDEAHTMGNLLGKGGGKFGRGAGPAQRAIAGAELQKRLPKARVVYVSATMATDVNEMAFADRLGLWGPGTQFNDVNDFVNKISSGGIAAMELVARDMKALGVYQARSISYDGVEYETLTHPLTPMQKEIYDTMSRAWQVTLQNMEKALNLTGANMNAQARAAAKSAYYGSMQRFYNQIVTSMAVPTVIKDIRKELAAGRSVVLQVVNTNEAQTNRKLAEAKEKGTELDELDITPREQLIGFLENSFPVQAFEEYEDENGNKRSRPVLDSKGKPVLDKKAVAMRDGMIAQIKEMRVPEGPLEMIFDAFGVEEVAEVTGRKRRVVPGKDAKGNTVKVEEKRSATSNEADVQAFQDGKKRILIFSDAGGTGKSYHADLRAKNQQQRVHYLLQPGWSAPKAVQGFGRTHRSNEASAPIYKLVTTDVRGQKRFVSTIARRLDQLGALTKGQRQTGSGMFSAKDNLESDLARDSLYNFYDALGRNRISGLDGRTVFRKLGLEDKFYAEGWFTLNSEVARDMSLFLNRILALEFDEQNEVFDAFSRTFDNAYDQALRNGTLDMGMETVRADKIEIIDDMTVREDPETGAKTQYVQAKLYEKPRIIRTLDDLAYYRSGFQGLVRKKNGDVAGVFRTIDKTEADGRVVKQFVLQSPMMGVMSHYVESTMEKETEPIPRKQWAKEWAAAVEKAPEYLESVRHMLTGTLLPVWNRLPDTGNVRVQRLIADDGRQYLGRVIPPAQIDGVLRQLGAKARTRETYTADDVIKQVFEKNGKKAVLYEERMEIVRRRVGGEWRLELLGDNLWFAERSYPGVYKEYINFKNRYFIPNGEAQKAVLEKILDQNGVRDIEDDRRSEDDGDAVHASIDPTGGMMHPERWTAERVGDREKQAKSLSEIMEQIRHDFGINITKGHIRGRGVMGQYDDSNRGMRIRSANDLPTSVHELGHHLDNVYQFSENLTAAEKKELLDQLPEELKARYKEKEQPGEGVAEFVRRFMTNRTTAALDYPEFTKKFLNTMNGHDRALVEQLADEVNAALALDVDTATSSIRLREDGRPDARTRKEKIKDVLERFYQAHNDSNYGIKRFDNAVGSNVYTLASNAAYADAIAGQICTGSVMTDINSNVVGLGLAAVFDGVNLDDTEEYIALGELLLVKHAPERIAEGMRIFADDRKNSEAFCKRREAEILKQYPNLAPVPARLYEFQKNLLQTWGVDLGLVSEESAEQWAKRWPQYVPLNRAVPVESRGFGGRRTFANQKNPFKKAVGSGLDIIHPVDSIIDHIITLVNSGVRNNVALALADAARDAPANAQLIEKIPTPMIPHKIGLEGVKQGIKDTAKMQLEKELIGDQAFLGIEAILHSMQDFMMQYTRQQPHGNIITVMRDGRPEYWKVNDPLLLRSLADMSPSRTRGVLDAYGRISRFITGNITGMNVLWSIFSNGPRDLGSFFAYAAERNPLKVFPAIASAYANYANLLRGKEVDPLYTAYLGMGGGSFSVYAADRDVAKSVREKLRRMTSDNAMKRIGWNPLDWIEYISNVVEQGPRFAIYKLLRLRGMTTQEAFYAATDVTVNFRRGGWIARDLNKVIPFYNAGVQGFDKFVRYFGAFDVPPGGPPKGPGLTGGDAGDGGNGPGGSGSGGSMPRDERSRVRRSRMMWYLIASAIAAAVSFAINHLTRDREEDYKRLSNWTKNNYFLVPIGDGRYFAISKPREVGVLSSFMESAAERVLMDDKHAMDGFYEYVTDVMLPGGVAEIAQGDWASAVGSMGLFGVGAYQMANRDFLGRPIVSSGLTKLESKDQYNDRTSKLAYYMGQAFNISPQRADFFFEQVLGGWWKYQKAVFPVASENRDLTLGVYNQYIKDSQYSTDLLNRMYDRTKASETAKNSDPDDMDKAIWYKMDNNLSTFYGRFYKLSKEDSRSEQARAARKAVLEMINEYEITRESGQDPTPFESVWGEVFDAVRETGKTELLPKVLNPLIKSEKGYGTDLNAQQYLEYQTKYNDLYADIVADALQNARNDSEKYALIAKANEVAQERAQDYMLKRLGVPETSAIEAKYGDVSDADIATFQALLYLAGQDGGVNQPEVIEALDRMRTQGLSREDASFLFETRYKPKNNPYK